MLVMFKWLLTLDFWLTMIVYVLTVRYNSQDKFYGQINDYIMRDHDILLKSCLDIRCNYVK